MFEEISQRKLFVIEQKTTYTDRIGDWSSDVCSSDLFVALHRQVVLGSAGIAADHTELEAERFFKQARHVVAGRSEEHTSELQSLMRISYAVFCLKKKTATHYKN